LNVLRNFGYLRRYTDTFTHLPALTTHFVCHSPTRFLTHALLNPLIRHHSLSESRSPVNLKTDVGPSTIRHPLGKFFVVQVRTFLSKQMNVISLKMAFYHTNFETLSGNKGWISIMPVSSWY
jgi:hypothetical protein